MLFDRTASLVIGADGGSGKELAGLRFSFSVEKGATKSPNKCSVKVWNLADTTRQKISVIGNVLILKAGYTKDNGAVQIFAGDVTRAATAREGADYITELELMDGLTEFRDTKVSVSYAAGVMGMQVIRSIASRFSLPVRELPTGITDRQYPAGFAFVGRLRDAMDKACDYLGLEWSIQGREVQVIKKGGVYRLKAIVLSPDSGMIDSPALESKTMTEAAAAKEGYTRKTAGVTETYQRDDETGEIEKVLQVNGLTVKSLLQPTIEPGGYVQIKSKGIDGAFFRVESLTHTGDTHGTEWHTNLTLRYT